MEAVDVAPNADLQELILAHTAPTPERFGPVTRPLLGAAATARLRDQGVHPAVLAACCADEATLDDLAGEFGAWPGPLDPIEAGVTAWQTCQALAANPRTSERAVWHLASTGRGSPAIERLVADAGAGRDTFLRNSLRAGTTPLPLLAALVTGTGTDVLTRLATDDRHGRLAGQLDRDPRHLHEPALAAAWVRHASVDALSTLLGSHRPTVVRAWAVAPAVLDALADRLADDPHLAGQLAAWFADTAESLFTSTAGVRLARALLEPTTTPVGPGRLAAVRDAAASSAAGAPDDLLVQYPALAVCVLELLRRRGLADPAAWRFVLATGPFPGPAGALADLAAAVADPPTS